MKPYNSYLHIKHTIIANKFYVKRELFSKQNNKKKCLVKIFQNIGYIRPTVTQLNKIIKKIINKLVTPLIYKSHKYG